MSDVTSRMTERAKKVLDLALSEALSMGHNYIGTEHILLGLVSENEGLASVVLLNLGLDADLIRNEVRRQLMNPKKARKDDPVAELIAALKAAIAAYEAMGSA